MPSRISTFFLFEFCMIHLIEDWVPKLLTQLSTNLYMDIHETLAQQRVRFKKVIAEKAILSPPAAATRNRRNSNASPSGDSRRLRVYTFLTVSTTTTQFAFLKFFNDSLTGANMGLICIGSLGPICCHRMLVVSHLLHDVLEYAVFDGLAYKDMTSRHRRGSYHTTKECYSKTCF